MPHSHCPAAVVSCLPPGLLVALVETLDTPQRTLCQIVPDTRPSPPHCCHLVATGLTAKLNHKLVLFPTYKHTTGTFIIMHDFSFSFNYFIKIIKCFLINLLSVFALFPTRNFLPNCTKISRSRHGLPGHLRRHD